MKKSRKLAKIQTLLLQLCCDDTNNTCPKWKRHVELLLRMETELLARCTKFKFEKEVPNDA